MVWDSPLLGVKGPMIGKRKGHWKSPCRMSLTMAPSPDRSGREGLELRTTAVSSSLAPFAGRSFGVLHGEAEDVVLRVKPRRRRRELVLFQPGRRLTARRIGAVPISGQRHAGIGVASLHAVRLAGAYSAVPTQGPEGGGLQNALPPHLADSDQA